MYNQNGQLYVYIIIAQQSWLQFNSNNYILYSLSANFNCSGYYYNYIHNNSIQNKAQYTQLLNATYTVVIYIVQNMYICNRICKKGLTHAYNFLNLRICNSASVRPTTYKILIAGLSYHCTYMREKFSILAYSQ